MSSLTLRSLVVAVLLVVLAGSGFAQVQNGSFENGFTSWTRSGDTLIVNNTLGYGPTWGTTQALISTATDGTINSAVTAGTGVIAATIESALGLPASSLSNVGNGMAALSSGISQSFSMVAGQKLTFDYDFLTNQTYNDGTAKSVSPDPNNNDFVWFASTLSGATTVTKVVDTTDGTLGQTTAITGASSPFMAHTGFRTFSFVAPSTGTYSIAIGVSHAVQNSADDGVNSAVLVDNVQTNSITSLAFQYSSLAPGGSTYGTAYLAAPANSIVKTISLSSDNPNVTVPASVDANSGYTTATFNLSVGAAASGTATITATFNGTVKTATLTIATALTRFYVGKTPIVGGNSSYGVIILNGPAPVGGLAVSLSSDSANAVVPATATLPAGSSSYNVAITTKGVASNATANITASYNGASFSSAIVITPANLLSLTPSTTSVTGGQSFTVMVKLDGTAPPAGSVIALSSSSSRAVIPSSTTITSGLNYKNVTVTTNSPGTTTTVTLTATYNGVSKIATVTVN